MQAVSSLTREHRVISELTAAFQNYAGRLGSAAPVNVGDRELFAIVFRELVDYRHHEKEEGILLPLLARNGFAWSSGVLCEIRQEHRQLRYLLDVLWQAADKEGTWGRGRRRQLAEAAMAFAEFKRGHMHKEEVELFPAVARRLRPEALAELATQLQDFDRVCGANPRSAQIWRFAEELIQRYSVDSTVIQAQTADLRGVA